MATNTFHFPTTGARAEGTATLLAIDDASLTLRRSLCMNISKPVVRAEPVLTPSLDNPDAPDALETFFYGTVLHEDGRFRMWYYPTSVGMSPDWPDEIQAQHAALGDDLYCGPICYAESDDGVNWVKPALRQMRFKGSLEHNGIWLPTLMTACATLIRDDEDPDPARRYKLAYWYQDSLNYVDWPSFATAVSADGLRWQQLDARPTAQFIEHGSFYKHGGLYIVNGQSAGGYVGSEGAGDAGRQGIAMVSTDFDHWLQEWAPSFLLPEPADREARGLERPYDQVHLGTGARSYGNVAVGVYCIWHNQPVFSEISGDFGLVVSNDGLAFREPVKGHVFLAADESPAPLWQGRKMNTVLTQGNGILNVGDTTYLYHGRWRNAGDSEGRYAEIALATLPRDRWGALGVTPGHEEGTVWTAPVTLPEAGCRVLLNAGGVGGMKVEVAEDRFAMIPGFSGEDAGTAGEADGLDCEVRWAKGDLATLGGRTVRFRVHLRDTGAAPARLYAIYLQECRQ